ncbi:hypothetical protein [Actinokineospora diospyrosa]|uniref:Guanylate cyclase domain-containing protein n=1 Tax=Actinokineospora diospyrosa TaxID=103728 RepID=A0ABT1IHP7_9PSEU|nr:hypothetical protein [Actinokineospora diospyrosa]MCP2272089.1 hypothetical protein [Actinokineospora diospyrosa]
MASRLPPYRALLGVDIKDFSGVAGRHHAEITERIAVVLATAFEKCGLRAVWDEQRFGFNTGDGYLAGFDTDVLPLLLTPFLASLQGELDYREQVRADPVPLRMRVSVNVGPVTDTGRGLVSEGSGVARIETHRLLDADPVRDLLIRSGTATRVAAIVSGRAFHDAVASGYSREPADLYVPAPVRVKAFTDVAYLRVPSPTGDLLHHGFLPHSESSADTKDTHRPGDAAIHAGRDVNQGNTTYTFNGPGNVNNGSGAQINGSGATYNDHRGSR